MKHRQFKPDDVHLMIDIETLGTQEQLVPIVSLAAVPFMLDKHNAKHIMKGRERKWYVQLHEQAAINYATVL